MSSLIIAAAGAGKTTFLVKKALEISENVLITTYTDANEQSIPKTMNFGLSKGLTFNRVLIYPTKPMLDWLSGKSKDMKDESLSKFYVAVTRARYSVAFVYKTKRLPTNDIGTKWTPDVL